MCKKYIIAPLEHVDEDLSARNKILQHRIRTSIHWAAVTSLMPLGQSHSNPGYLVSPVLVVWQSCSGGTILHPDGLAEKSNISENDNKINKHCSDVVLQLLQRTATTDSHS